MADRLSPHALVLLAGVLPEAAVAAMNRAIRRQAARSVGKPPAANPAIDDLFVPAHVVEPLRSELVAKIHRRLRESGLMFTDVVFWVDMVAWAINERLDEHGGRNSATPMEAVR